MSDELARQAEKKTIEIGGKKYILSPINWRILKAIETKFDRPINRIKPLLDDQPFTTTLALAEIFLRDDNPDFKVDILEQLTDHAEIARINNAVGEIIQEFFQGGS